MDRKPVKKKETLVGRPTKYEKAGIPLEMIGTIYEEAQTIHRTAEILKVSEKTVRNYLKKLNYKTKRGPKPISILPENHKHYSAFVGWVRNHPEAALPRSIKKIQTLTGCTYDAIRSYLYRRKKAIIDKLNDLPDLTALNVFLKSTSGKLFSTKTTKAYTWTVDQYTLKASGTFESRTGRKFKVNLTIEQLVKKLKDELVRQKNLMEE